MLLRVIKHNNNNYFNGFLFVKFASVERRTWAIKTFNAMKAEFANKHNFMNPDLPIQQRAPRSFLNSLKKLFINSWGFAPSSVRWSEKDLTLAVSGNPVLRASVDTGTCEVEFLMESWATWGELTEDSEIRHL